MILSEMSIQDIKIGIRVWSADKSQAGTITQIDHPESKGEADIWIDWDNGDTSLTFHCWCKELELVCAEEQT